MEIRIVTLAFYDNNLITVIFEQHSQKISPLTKKIMKCVWQKMKFNCKENPQIKLFNLSIH